MKSYLKNFGLKHDPLGKNIQEIDNSSYQQLMPHLNWLLETRGVGLIIGEAGVGKTTGIRQWTNVLNPHTHRVYYTADNHFKAFDIYSQLAEALEIEPQHRYSRLWRNIKRELVHLHDEKKITPIWILDEAHQLPLNFFADLPAFLNFSFDTRDIMIILLIGLPKLEGITQRSIYSALESRTKFCFEWQALDDFEKFNQFIVTALEKAGSQQILFSQSGIKLIHLSTKGRLRFADKLITKCLQLASEKTMNHVSDDIIKIAVEQLRKALH
jgi:MSHA biogenesis protein MshM